MTTDTTSALLAAAAGLGETTDDILAACETIYGHGCSDDQLGDVDGFGHYYLISRWIVQTDTRGFHHLHEYVTEDDARADWDILSADYSDYSDTQDS